MSSSHRSNLRTLAGRHIELSATVRLYLGRDNQSVTVPPSQAGFGMITMPWDAPVPAGQKADDSDSRISFS
jgi:hypothetical protein